MTATEPLYSTDAYLRTFEATILEVDADGHRVALNRTAFYPGGGGQPNDEGGLRWHEAEVPVTSARSEGPLIWHTLPDDAPLPYTGAEV